MELDSLVLEVTRRCNLTCDHCLRGDAQTLDMTEAVIDATLKGVTYISNVTFSGGEPTLNVPIIRYFIEQVKRLGIGISSFYMATNGLDPSIEVIHALIDLYTLVDSPECSQLAWSNDSYHGTKEPELYKALRFFAPRYDDDQLRRYGEGNLINEGRAEENCLAKHRHTLETLSLEYEQTESLFEEGLIEESIRVARVESTVYIAANGNVMTDCDCSFEKVDRLAIGNVLTGSLEQMLRTKYEEPDNITP